MVVGFIFLNIAITPVTVVLNNGLSLTVNQQDWFLWASLFFLLGSVIWMLFLFGIVRTKLGYGIMAVSLFIGAYVLYLDYAIIAKDVATIANWNMMDSDIRARILDIKEAELAYKESNGKYTSNIEELITFVHNGKKMIIKKNGPIPDRKISEEERSAIYGDDRPIDFNMTEIEAYAIVKKMGPFPDGHEFFGFQRDTAYIPVLDAIFHDPKYVVNRDKTGCRLAFNADSMRYVPYSSIPVLLDTGSVMKGEIKVYTLQINMIHPMDSTLYQIGDVNDNHLRESWKK